MYFRTRYPPICAELTMPCQFKTLHIETIFEDTNCVTLNIEEYQNLKHKNV